MATLADTTVKKWDGTTDVVFKGLTPSSGELGEAVFRQDAGQTAPIGLRPVVKLKTRTAKGPRKAHVTEVNGMLPATYTDANTGLILSNGGVTMKVVVTVDREISSTAQQEGVAQLLNMAASTLFKTAMFEGYGIGG